jgi:hypothetical protein
MIPNINCYYQHRYGGLYIVKDIATSTVDKSKWVVYNHVYPFDYQTWIRPYDEWCDGRFRQLDNDEYIKLIKQDREAFKLEIAANKEAANKP